MKNYFKKFSIIFTMTLTLVLGTCVSAFAVDSEYSENLIPKMTSNTSPSGIASASSSFGSKQPYLAFDHGYSGTDGGNWMAYSTSLPQWISYKFPTPKKICKYTIAFPDGYEKNAPKNWTFDGSNDDENWYILDSQTNINFSEGEKKAFTFDNSDEYTSYRIRVTALINSKSSYGVGIDEIEMMENTQNDTSITLDKSTMDLNVGDSQQLTATTTPSAVTVNWKSSDTLIAGVDSTGKVTAGNNVGTCTITATTTDGLTAACIVTVTNGGTTEPTGDANLYIELVDGQIKQYTVSSDEINKFTTWYENRDKDNSLSATYKFTKGTYTDYVVHDKIDWFEVR